MEDEGDTWGCGVWTVKDGREDEFVERWRSLTEWTLSRFPGNGPARLLQDREDSRRFVSLFPWTELSQVEQWRSAPEFQELYAHVEETLEAGERRTYELRLELG